MSYGVFLPLKLQKIKNNNFKIYPFATVASNINNARLTFRSLFSNKMLQKWSVTIKFSFLATFRIIGNNCSEVGAGKRITMQRLMMGSMILFNDVQHKKSLHDPAYFSIVRRKACWASKVSKSASCKMTTERRNSKNCFYKSCTSEWLLVNRLINSKTGHVLDDALNNYSILISNITKQNFVSLKFYEFSTLDELQYDICCQCH